MNLLARLNARFPWAVLGSWFIIFLALLPFATQVGSRFDSSGGGVKNSEWQRVLDILVQDFNQPALDSLLLVSESSLEPQSREFQNAYSRLLEKIQALKGIQSLTRYNDPSIPLARAGKASNMHITVTLIASEYGFPALLSQIRAAAKASAPPNTKFFVTGASAVNQDFAYHTEQDVRQGELTALPLTALVLVLAFGALVAAGLPMMVGLVAITLTMAALYFVTFLLPVSSFSQSVVTLFGLGAGIDYALLVVSRFREYLAAGQTPKEAAFGATQTAGRAVLLSGLTVAIAMSALLVPDLAVTRSIGIAGLLTMTFTVLVSITALPAILALLGQWVNLPRIWRNTGQPSRFWGRHAARVMARPLPWGLGAALVLLLLSTPTLTMRLGYTGAFGLGANIESRQGLERISKLELAGSLDTFDVLLDLGQQPYSAETRERWRSLDQSIAAWQDVRLVVSPFSLVRLTQTQNTSANSSVAAALGFAQSSISSSRRYLKMQIIPRQSLNTLEVGSWLSRIRTAAAAQGFYTVLIGGAPKSAHEITQSLIGVLPQAIGLVFAATFVLLLVVFRSILVPLKSILLNSLSVAASYGVVTLVLQHGFLAEFLNAPTDVGLIDVTMPLVLFAVIFGLSMDYEIFLLSRMQEAHLAGCDTPSAVKIALERTGSVISSAALVMVIVFAAFIPGNVVVNKTLGLGLSMAVALDATLIRVVLVPSLMVWAGKWNWWLPAWLDRRLPKIQIEH
ncbi:MAG: MMPL family transporter [Deinococcales bacterium]